MLLRPWVSGAAQRPRFSGRSGEATESAQSVEVLGSTILFLWLKAETFGKSLISLGMAKICFFFAEMTILCDLDQPCKTCKNHSVPFHAILWALYLIYVRLKCSTVQFLDKTDNLSEIKILTGNNIQGHTLLSCARGRRWTLSKNERWSAGCQSRLYLGTDLNYLVGTTIIWN